MHGLCSIAGHIERAVFTKYVTMVCLQPIGLKRGGERKFQGGHRKMPVDG
jgi:hypothetical protein